MRVEERDNMIIEFDVEIKMDDGVILRADIYRPKKEGKYPTIISYGPYGKSLHFSQRYQTQWEILKRIPEIFENTTGKYMTWETVDPEKWVPDGYVVVRIDSRGAGRSEGFLDPHSPRETKDIFNCIEWVATQHWSNGKVGMTGISYYAVNAWRVASLNPPHLVAICPWEGSVDNYRDSFFHGGIPSLAFRREWYKNQVLPVQHGLGERGFKSIIDGEWVSGPITLSEEDLKKNRTDIVEDVIKHPLDDEYHKSRSAKLENINIPVLSCGNWGGLGLHLRGNTEGFIRSSSSEKWLEIHGRPHWVEFYTNYGLALQKKFFDYYLKGIDNGWKDTPRVILWIRHTDGSYELRAENEWPLERTRWTKFYIDSSNLTLSMNKPDKESFVEYDATGEGVTFLSSPLAKETEITGPVAAKLYVSSSTMDADLFLTLRAFSPNMKEVTFYDYLDPHTPLTQGWLRVSHRKLDTNLNKEWRPYHTHDEIQYIKPNEIYEVDIELWPTSVCLPEGYGIGLTIRGIDWEYPGGPIKVGYMVMSGSGPFYHEFHPKVRPRDIYDNKVKIYSGGKYNSYLLLPFVPPKDSKDQKELNEKISWLQRHFRPK